MSKTNNNITTNYYLEGTKILAQSNGNTLIFHYGMEGIIGFTYQGVGEYYYKKNILGDVIGIIDSSGQEVAKYVYDAWGNHKVYAIINANIVDITNDTNYNNHISKINPFRYRSYYFDTETGLYYLNSRYYDPEIGRFINADDIGVLDLTNIAINGLNLYAYCLNNPVNEVDEDGYVIWFFIAIAAFAILGGVGSAVSQGISKGWDNINWATVGFDALMGALTGMLIASGVGAVGLATIGGTIGLVNSVGDQLIEGTSFNNIDWLTVGISTVLGAVPGFKGKTGAINTNYLNRSLHFSSKYVKAAASYDKVLTKIANGEYKNLAGAAGARFLTTRNLQNVWNEVNFISATSRLLEYFARKGLGMYVKILEAVERKTLNL